MVRKVGIEPTWYCYHQILSLERMPIPPLSHNGSPSWTRTSDIWINSPPFYRLNYRGILVRMERIELSRCFHPGILSPMRLPIPPHSHDILFLFYRLINIVVIKDIGQGPSSYSAFWEQYWCPSRDLNPDWTGSKPDSSACWDRRAHKTPRYQLPRRSCGTAFFDPLFQVEMRWGFLFLQSLRLSPYRLHDGSPGRTRTYNILVNSQAQLPIVLLRNNGGWCRIRTYGTFQHDGFQDRCLKPLGQPSIMVRQTRIEIT